MAEIRTPKNFTNLTAITSIDGRFRGSTEDLNKYFSEMATSKGRVKVEIEYLIAFLSEIKKPLDAGNIIKLRKIYQNFSETDTLNIWKKDEEINHDTKAVEYFLQGKLTKIKLNKLINYLHFGLTSTDIDNTGLSLLLKEFSGEIFLKKLKDLIEKLKKLSREQNDLVMPARTHGQIAVPTTAGKEWANFAHRLQKQVENYKKIKLGSKLTGAVGNYNALELAFPEIDWIKFSEKFMKSMGLENYPMTTQVEPYDNKVEWIEAIKRINLIVLALCQDVWHYLALGYLSQRDDKGHIGSSTMPQKINPIGFELAENYCSLANGIFEVMERRLPENRWQRDLTDKYLLRDLGQALSMSVLSYESVARALETIGFNKQLVEKELSEHWEIIAEGVQTLLRTAEISDPYGKLKELTRGKKVTQKDYQKFLEKMDIPIKLRKKLKLLSPTNYIGLAKKLAATYHRK
ncbi:MAG TPA: adenylosuccinate lyase [Candidatus Woesebacteria bacterium]|nr:adenylosuccinate lyase [Candidatus Woesebacteria bacterium]